MKKRIFGMLLMGAMVVASMSMFTSCKDYDDDINANKAEIAALKTSLQEQKTSLEAAIAAVKSEAATANATLNTKLTELTTLVGNNKTELENAIKTAVTDSKAYADGVSAEALKVAKEYADAAAKEAAATAKAEALEEAKKLTDELAAKMAEGDEANAKALAEKADELVAKISAVDDKLVKLIDAEKEERINALAAVNTQIENIKLQIAALEKFKTEISKKVSDIATDLDKTKTVLESVKKAAEENAKAIKKNKEDIAAINTALTVIDGKIAGLEEQVELLKKADVDLKALISANTAEIAAVKDAYQKADAALKQEFEGMLKNYYTKAEIDEILKGYAKTTIDGYTVPADVEKYVSEVKADMENQITETLNAYDQKLAAALVALFGADDAEGAAAAEVSMSDEAIEALKALKENYNNGINKAVEAELNVLKVAQSRMLTSLVFIPDSYYDGIETVEVLALQDSILALVDPSKDGKVSELWGVLGDAAEKNIHVPDSAIAKYYWVDDLGEQHVVWTKGEGAYNLAPTDWTPVWGAKENVVFYKHSPLAKAHYHMNPTTADIKGAKLSFYTNVAKVNWNQAPTRAPWEGDVIATPVPAEVDADYIAANVENGILTVPFEVDRVELDRIRYAKGTSQSFFGMPIYSQEAFIALQATLQDEEGNDTTVTSDYALLAPNDIDIVALSGDWMCDEAENHWFGSDHLWTKLIAGADQGGIDCPITSGFVLYNESGDYYSPIKEFTADYRLPVVYDGSIDLAEHVLADFRYGYRNADGVFTPSSKCQHMTKEMMKDLGLHLEFKAIHYLSGSNKTDEWEHIQLDGSVAYPRSVTEAGKQIPDQTAGREVIGRMPIVRATLVTDDTDEVLAVGYILLEIVSKNVDDTPVVIDLTNDYYMNCTAQARITWSQVEALILAQVQLSKTEFESLYELETMAMNVDYAGRWGSADYIDHNVVKRTAVQYMNVNGKFVSFFDVNKKIKESDDWAAANDVEKAAMLKYPLGSVYEYVNDEQQQTTVLEWNIGSEVRGSIANTYLTTAANQSQETSIQQAIIQAAASAASKGLSTEVVEVTVAYKQTDINHEYLETNRIFVTLRVPVGKLHFAYAEVAGKDLSLWYQENSWLNAANADESDAIEIHLNTPTPGKKGWSKSGTNSTWITSNQGDDALFGDLFYKKLSTTFQQGLVKAKSLDNHFTKFAGQTFSYRLVDPTSAGAKNITSSKQKLSGQSNSSSAEYDKSWQVKGISGATYLLQVQSNVVVGDVTYDFVNAVAWVDPTDGKAYDIDVDGATAGNQPAEITRLVVVNPATTGATPTLQTSLVYANNAYAQDILNYAGRYDQAKDDLQREDGEYLTREDKTFTSFIRILPDKRCYDLMMPNSFFKARWLRPINVVGGDKDWEDGTNVVQTAKIAELVEVYDWRLYEVKKAQTGEKTPVHSMFYEINDSTFRHFYADFNEIRTDHDLAATGTNARKLLPTEVTEIEKLTLAKDLPSLQEENNFFRATLDGNNNLVLEYKNNDANVGEFHFYVPVYVCYAFGDYWYKKSNKTIGNIHANRTTQRTGYGKEPAPEVQNYVWTNLSGTPWTDVKANWKPIFTQKTYAVITVKQTDNSHTGGN